MLLHYIAEIESSRNIVVIIKQGFCAGFTNCLKTRKMNTAVNIVFGKDLIKRIVVKKVYLVKFKVLTRDPSDTLQRLRLTVNKVINYYKLSACFKQLYHGMRADITRATRNQNSHNFSFLVYIHKDLFIQRFRILALGYKRRKTLYYVISVLLIGNAIPLVLA